MKFGIQSGENTLILNILFGIGNLNPNFGATIEVLNDFMKFGIKNRWNIFSRYSLPAHWANFILKLKYTLLLFIRLKVACVVDIKLFFYGLILL